MDAFGAVLCFICSEHCLRDMVTLLNLEPSNQQDLIVAAHLNMLHNIVSNIYKLIVCCNLIQCYLSAYLTKSLLN